MSDKVFISTAIDEKRGGGGWNPEHTAIGCGGTIGGNPHHRDMVLLDGKYYSPPMVKALILERDNAFAQNAELMAQVERLNQAVISTRARGNLLHNITIGLIQGSELNGSDWDYISEEQVDEIAQHLRDIQAEAGRAGFAACLSEHVGAIHPDFHGEIANQYADRVRRGEK